LEGVKEVGRGRSEGRVEEERFLETEGWKDEKNARDEGERKEKSAGGLDLANEAIGKETK